MSADAIRRRVYAYMAASGMSVKPAAPCAEEPVLHSWQIYGDAVDGVSASFSDADDVIEISLLSRADGEPTNMLHASITLDEGDARIYCTSDTSTELNFEAALGPEQSADGLFMACDYFAQVVGLSASVQA